MNDILQKRIEEAARNFNQKEGIPYALIGHVFNAFMEGGNFALQNQWISVSKSLPQKDDLYFVLINDTHPRVTEFEQGKWQGYDNITHWMEIPKNT